MVTTLLLNFVVLLGVSAMLDGPMKDPTAMGWPQSVVLQDALQLDKLIERETGILVKRTDALDLARRLLGELAADVDEGVAHLQRVGGDLDGAVLRSGDQGALSALRVALTAVLALA